MLVKDITFTVKNKRILTCYSYIHIPHAQEYNVPRRIIIRHLVPTRPALSEMHTQASWNAVITGKFCICKKHKCQNCRDILHCQKYTERHLNAIVTGVSCTVRNIYTNASRNVKVTGTSCTVRNIYRCILKCHSNRHILHCQKYIQTHPPWLQTHPELSEIHTKAP